MSIRRFKGGSTIELDCWMPGEQRHEETARSRRRLADSRAGLPRRLPRLRPIGVERYSGSVGVRRPGDWTGRFDPIPDTEPISDESFVKSWGSLPEEPLTLCGTSRFVARLPSIALDRPDADENPGQADVQLQLESGRIVMTVEAELSELSGHLRQHRGQAPRGYPHHQVTADGLADWTTTLPIDRLRLMFDRPFSRPQRRLRVLGWIPLAEDPLQIGLATAPDPRPVDPVGRRAKSRRRLPDGLLDIEARDPGIDGHRR